MAVIKCKMCGGDVELAADKSIGMCEYCGSTMTFPKIDDEQRAAAFNRGNHFRRIGEFDKALAVYERIVREDESDAEAHWCCALCRFGIEYVEDPATLEWLPTCHRASFDSFLEDVDYLAALEHSDGLTRRQYQKDANKIAEVQRGILATSQNAEPYDVFICYKESDESGRRTVDSTLAQDIYYQLTEQGRKVFFARITLEDVVGTQYEPYIFAALNSAKVMIVVGTKPEYLNAVWVKNEWSRFLAMMKKDHHKLLLPCYRDMDPYDLPEQLSVLQSYDMAKIGFIQDLIRGVAKVLDAQQKPVAVKETVVVNQAAPATNIAPLLKRAFMFLEDGEFDRADEFCEQVLNLDPECAMAYLGKLMAELKVNQQEHLKDQAEPFDTNGNYQKAVRFADADLRATITGYIDHIVNRNLEALYQKACGAMDAAGTEAEFNAAAAQFERIRDYKDSADLAEKCLSNGKEAKLMAQYQAAVNAMNAAQSEYAYIQAARMFRAIADYKDSDALAQECMERAEGEKKDAILAKAISISQHNAAYFLEQAIEMLRTIPGWRNADELVEKWGNELQHRKKQEEEKRIENQKKTEKMKVLAILASIAVTVFVIGLLVWNTVVDPAIKYNNAMTLMERGQYDQAISAFTNLSDYKDSWERIKLCYYGKGAALMDAGKNAEAAIAFSKAGDYEDAREWSKFLWDQTPMRGTIDVGFTYTVGLKADGTVVAVGNNDDGQCYVGGWTDIVSISAGSDHTVGLKSDGTVVATGRNGLGQCNIGGWTDIVAVSAGSYHTVGLKTDGTVVAAGRNGHGHCNVGDWTDIVAVSAGSDHTVGLKADGTVVAVGYNGFGECNVTGWTDIVAISADGYHTVGLKADGTVVIAGSTQPDTDDVTNWKNIAAICTGNDHIVGLKSDGTVVVAGTDSFDKGFNKVSDWTNVVAISAGYGYTVGLRADGTVLAAGDNDNDQYKAGDWTDIQLPNK